MADSIENGNLTWLVFQTEDTPQMAHKLLSLYLKPKNKSEKVIFRNEY